MTYRPFVVKSAASGATLDGIPTPALIENGGGMAYEGSPGIWRLRDTDYGDPGYDPEGTEYTRVRVVHEDQYIVDLEYEIHDPSDLEGPLPERTSVWVQASNRYEAEDRAKQHIMDMTEKWGITDGGVAFTIIRTEKQ